MMPSTSHTCIGITHYPAFQQAYGASKSQLWAHFLMYLSLSCTHARGYIYPSSHRYLNKNTQSHLNMFTHMHPPDGPSSRSSPCKGPFPKSLNKVLEQTLAFRLPGTLLCLTSCYSQLGIASGPRCRESRSAALRGSPPNLYASTSLSKSVHLSPQLGLQVESSSLGVSLLGRELRQPLPGWHKRIIY